MNLFVCLTLLLAALVITDVTDVKGMINLYFFLYNFDPFLFIGNFVANC